MLNDETLINCYEPSDIGTLYWKLTATYPDDTGLHIERFHFMYNIEDREEEALQFLTEYRRRSAKKLAVNIA